MKLCVLGGCGARSVFMAKSLATNARAIGVDEIVFMDNAPARVAAYGALASAVAARVDNSIRFRCTVDACEALAGADYIITTIRAGGDEARALDEQICFDHGVLGQETTGAGGFAMALRNLPALRGYCELASRVASPGHLIFNFTNPSGIITQALRSLGFSNVIGICDAASGFQAQLGRVLGVPAESVSMRCYGLNHFSWFDRVRVNGKDVTERLLADEMLYTQTEMRLFDRSTLPLFGGRMPNEYLYFYFDRVRSYESIANSGNPRGKQIVEINRALDAALSALNGETERAFHVYMTHYAMRENAYFAAESGKQRPERLDVPTLDEFIAQPDKGGYAAVALQYIRAVTSGNPCEMVLSVPNAGAIDGFSDGDVVEISCRVGRDGPHPMPIGRIDELLMLQMRAIKYFECQTIRAALEGDRDAAVRALYVHPLVNDLRIARALAGRFMDAYAGKDT